MDLAEARPGPRFIVSWSWDGLETDLRREEKETIRSAVCAQSLHRVCVTRRVPGMNKSRDGRGNQS